MIELNTEYRRISIFPGDERWMVYLHAGEDEARRIHDLFGGSAVAAVDGIDWNHDLTPWPGKAVFRRQPDFGGGAEAYLRELTEEIIPSVEQALACAPERRILAGYSLAGLFAVWAGMNSGAFDAVASVSGSLWYPGFAALAEKAPFFAECAYFSVGEREKLGRNTAFRSIETDTKRVADSLEKRGVKTVFELNPGGHFAGSAQRTVRGLKWIQAQWCGEGG